MFSVLAVLNTLYFSTCLNETYFQSSAVPPNFLPFHIVVLFSHFHLHSPSSSAHFPHLVICFHPLQSEAELWICSDSLDFCRLAKTGVFVQEGLFIYIMCVEMWTREDFVSFLPCPPDDYSTSASQCISHWKRVNSDYYWLLLWRGCFLITGLIKGAS